MRSRSKRIWHNYYLEILFALGSSAYLSAFIFLLYRLRHKTAFTTVAAEVSIATAGFTFLAGQIYGRLRDRREVKRQRAIEIFKEWHSPALRASRKYISHWRKFRGGQGHNMPALSQVEDEASEFYGKKVVSSSSTEPHLAKDELDDPEKMEEHFFAIYQFFERWYLYEENGDIDREDANSYMHSYKGWYIDNFIQYWKLIEKDDYIHNSLSGIIRNLSDDCKK